MSHAHFPPAPGNSAEPIRGGAGATRSILALAIALALAFGALVGLARPADAVTISTSLLDTRTAVVHLTNLKRAVKGCKPLKVSTRLTTAAQRHANDMSRKDYFSHTSADGTKWYERIEDAGWTRPGGENIAMGFTSATSVLKGWMASPGHKRNILDCHFHYIGVGYASSGKYWVQDFGY
jgi:uncharacterized protein YkwD